MPDTDNYSCFDSNTTASSGSYKIMIQSPLGKVFQIIVDENGVLSTIDVTSQM